MDMTEIRNSEDISEVIELFNANGNNEQNGNGLIEITLDGAENALSEEDKTSTGNTVYDDSKEHAEKGGTPIFIRLIGGLLCFVFCTVSAAFYAEKSVKTVKGFLALGIESSVSREVFDDKLTVIKAENADEIGATKPDTEDISNESKETADETDTENGNPPSENKTFGISEVDLSARSPFDLSNETSFSPDAEKMSESGNSFKSVSDIYSEYGDSAPCVLIVHTHGTEAYSSGDSTYSENDAFRTEDTLQNVVAVGDIMKKTLELSGINVIHDRNMYDKESYRDSYSRCYEAVSETLKNNPSVSYVLDVHRDAIIDSDKTKYRPVFTYEGMKCAQMMIVVGTDEGGAVHDNWRNNLTFALKVQSRAFSDVSPSLSRNVNLRCAAFNQALSEGSILLEIGSCGNTLNEAKRCGILTALSIAKTVGAPENPNPSELLKSLVPDT